MPRFEKSTFNLTAEAKRELRSLKAALRYEGLYATQDAIVDRLILSAKIEQLRESLRDSRPMARGKAAKKMGPA